MSLTDEDVKRLDDRYVTKDDCERKTDKTQENIAEMRADMSVMCATQKATNKWLGVIATAIITGIVGIILARIFGG